jgi:hypothetical protein
MHAASTQTQQEVIPRTPDSVSLPTNAVLTPAQINVVT